MGDKMGTALETVLSEIQGLRSDVREDNSKLWEAVDKERECTTKLKIENERRKAEAEKLELKQGITEKAFVKHVQNPEKHFQPFYNEKLRTKLWRKKPEIGAGVIIATSLVSLILAMLKGAGWIQ